MNFRSHCEALKKVESITNKIVDFTNEGLEINLTSFEVNEANTIKEKLSKIFTNVYVTGRKFKSIKIDYVSQDVQRSRITQVVY